MAGALVVSVIRCVWFLFYNMEDKFNETSIKEDNRSLLDSLEYKGTYFGSISSTEKSAHTLKCF